MKIVIEGTPEEIRALMQKEPCCEQSSDLEVTEQLIQSLTKALRNTLDTKF